MAKKTRAAKKPAGKRSPAKKPKEAKKASAPRRRIPRPATAAPVPVTREMVAKRAYEIWQKKNHAAHSNHPVQNWLEAEAEFRVRTGK
jgi:DUF2934 family protein